jgi:DNA-binding NarL/FixJ family response regulator
MRVLLVDHHDLFRTGLRALLEEEGFEVADATSGEAALLRLRSFPARVVIMDMHMPGMSGAVATARVLEQAPDTSVLILTLAADEKQILAGIRAGASGYLLKDAELSQIVAGVRAAAAGQSPLDPCVAASLLAHVRASTPPVERDPSASLSPREREVLALLTEGCDNIEIGQRLFLSSSTVKSHVSRLFAKLGVDNRVQAAVMAARNEDLRPSVPVSPSRLRALRTPRGRRRVGAADA